MVGIAIVYKDQISVKQIPPPRKSVLFESLCIQVDSKLVILAIYFVPGKSSLNVFLRDLDDYLSQLMTMYTSVINCSDPNIHFENRNDQTVVSLLSMMNDLGS